MESRKRSPTKEKYKFHEQKKRNVKLVDDVE